MNNKTTNILLVTAILLVIVLIGVGLWLIFQGTTNMAAQPPTATPLPPTSIAAATTAVPTLLPTATIAQVVLLPSATPIPTDVPTETPVSTDTPVPTETPLPTNTAVPIVYPTATPIPPTPLPTNTPGPPPGPQPVSINGISGTHFAVQSRAQFCPNCKLWFEFAVSNSTGGDVPFSTLGVVPRKDGRDRWEWFQKSWGGNNDKIKPGGISWEDNINIPEAGNYTLRLVICFDAYDTCRAGGGTHHTLSQEIPVTIN